MKHFLFIDVYIQSVLKVIDRWRFVIMYTYVNMIHSVTSLGNSRRFGQKVLQNGFKNYLLKTFLLKHHLRAYITLQYKKSYVISKFQILMSNLLKGKPRQ